MASPPPGGHGVGGVGGVARAPRNISSPSSTDILIYEGSHMGVTQDDAFEGDASLSRDLSQSQQGPHVSFLPRNTWDSVPAAFVPEAAARRLANDGTYAQAIDEASPAVELANTNWLAANGWLAPSSKDDDTREREREKHAFAKEKYAAHLRVPGMLAQARRKAESERIEAERVAELEKITESKKQLRKLMVEQATKQPQPQPEEGQQQQQQQQQGKVTFGAGGKARPRSRASRVLSSETPLELPNNKPRRVQEESVYQSTWRKEVESERPQMKVVKSIVEETETAAKKANAFYSPVAAATSNKLLALMTNVALDENREQSLGKVSQVEYTLPYGHIDPQSVYDAAKEYSFQPPPPEWTEEDEEREAELRDGPLDVIGGKGSRSFPAIQKEARRRAYAANTYAANAINVMVSSARERHHRPLSPPVQLHPMADEASLDLP